MLGPPLEPSLSQLMKWAEQVVVRGMAALGQLHTLQLEWDAQTTLSQAGGELTTGAQERLLKRARQEEQGYATWLTNVAVPLAHPSRSEALG